MTTVLVRCDNRLRFAVGGENGLPKDAVERLDALTFHANPQFKKLQKMGYIYNSEPQAYRLIQVNTEETEASVPRGCMDLFRQVISEFGLQYEVEDLRTMGDASATGSYQDPWNLQGGCLFPTYKKVLWAHQQRIVDAIRLHQQCLIRSPTGSGKTSAIIAAIAAMSVPSLVIMWDTGLLEQWQERVEAELGIAVKDQGLIQGKVCRLRGVTLAMQQTLAQYKPSQWDQIVDVFGLVACDEVQRYAAKTFLAQVDRFPGAFRIGVSADERRKDSKHFLIYAMFGQVKLEIPRKELIENRLIHDVEVFVVPTNFRADWYAAARENEKPREMDFNRLLDEMQADQGRNELAVHLATECVHKDLPTLMFTHRVDHAMIMDRMVAANGIKSGLALGGEDFSDMFSATIDGLRKGRLMVGCGTFQKLGVGHDIPTVAAGIVVTPVHNNKPFLGQVKGRICRTSAGKQNARIIILWDQHVFGDVPLHNLKRWNDRMQVWCAWDKRWKPAAVFLKERSDGRAASVETKIDGLFASANG